MEEREEARRDGRGKGAGKEGTGEGKEGKGEGGRGKWRMIGTGRKRLGLTCISTTLAGSDHLNVLLRPESRFCDVNMHKSNRRLIEIREQR
eukprot:672420-Hanusia_phi.AAC.1